jgi:acyl carrier protein
MADIYRNMIRRYLLDSFALPSLDDGMDIFEAQIANSLFAIQLMTFLEKNANIRIGADDLDLAHFKSVDSISAFVDRKKSAQAIP